MAVFLKNIWKNIFLNKRCHLQRLMPWSVIFVIYFYAKPVIKKRPIRWTISWNRIFLFKICKVFMVDIFWHAFGKHLKSIKFSVETEEKKWFIWKSLGGSTAFRKYVIFVMLRLNWKTIQKTRQLKTVISNNIEKTHQ